MWIILGKIGAPEHKEMILGKISSYKPTPYMIFVLGHCCNSVIILTD